MHGDFEAGPDEVEEDLEEVAGDVDAEASSGRELAEDEAVDGDAMMEREFFRNHESNMKEKLSCEPLLSQNSPPLDFQYSDANIRILVKKFANVVETLFGPSRFFHYDIAWSEGQGQSTVQVSVSVVSIKISIALIFLHAICPHLVRA